MAADAGTITAGGATPEPEGVRRRDFINIAAVSAAGIGGLATLVPLISQMSPSADVLAESSRCSSAT
jgi:ubiquinol-cytochrome c reductase iron-sulfur subunit